MHNVLITKAVFNAFLVHIMIVQMLPPQNALTVQLATVASAHLLNARHACQASSWIHLGQILLAQVALQTVCNVQIA